jgi:hypothetical protein
MKNKISSICRLELMQMKDYKDELQLIVQRFGRGEPVFSTELAALFPGKSRRALYYMVERLVDDGDMGRHSQGVYYVPQTSKYGLMPLSDSKVIEKKYCGDGTDVYGYYTGLTLENHLMLTTMFPMVLEVATNNTSSAQQAIVIGNSQRLIVYKSRVPVSADNVDVLRFLDVFTDIELEAMDEYEMGYLKKYLETVDRSAALPYLKYYPAKTAKNIMEAEANGILA